MLDILSKNNPKNIAIIKNNFSKTYSELEKDIKFLKCKFNKGEVILLLCDSSDESIIIYLACLQASSIPLLLSDNISQEMILEYERRYLPSQIFSPKIIDLGRKEDAVLEGYFVYSTSNKCVVKNKNLALLLTTSGSTGNPKVVKVSRKNLIANTKSICKYLKLSEKDRHITTLPMNYTYGLSCINTFLYSGGSIILNSNAITTKEFWTNLENYHPTHLAGVPYTYEILSRYFLNKLKNSSIKVFTQAGGKLSNNFIEKFLKFSEETQKEFIIMYGQTEATARMSYLPFNKLKQKIGSIGKAIPGGKFSLRNIYKEKSFNKKIGELVYEGENVTDGYANTFNDLDYIKENNFKLNTGDIAWIDEDNYVFLLGRINRFAKINGIRVSLVDVENIISKLGYPCAVISDDIDLKVYIEIPDKISLDMNKMKKEITSKINISPNSINLTRRARLPRIESGKIDYKAMEHKNFE